MKHAFNFKVVKCGKAADPDTVRVTLYRCDTGVCAWYLGPISVAAISEAYLPTSAKMIASRAILRAIDLAEKISAGICIVDPEGLWSEAWGGLP